MNNYNLDAPFVSVPNGSATLDYFLVKIDGEVILDVNVNSYERYRQIAPNIKDLLLLPKDVESWIDSTRSTAKSAGIELSKSDAYRRLLTERTLAVLGGTRYILNSKQPFPSVTVGYDALAHPDRRYFLNVSNDFTYQLNKSQCKRSDVLDSFFNQLENGDWLLYYLNEFRNIRRIPALMLIGTGGSGKSRTIDLFKSYKHQSCTRMFGEKYTGNFGQTSLIVCEEPSDERDPNLSWDVVKDLQTSNTHSVRLMHQDPSLAYGFVTLLFSSNDTPTSKLMHFLNRRGEDVNAVKRRISTFYFSDDNKRWLESQGRTFIESLVDSARIDRDEKTSVLDQHLNWCEQSGKFRVMDEILCVSEYKVVHSSQIEICSRLSRSADLFIDSLYSIFFDKSEGESIKFDELFNSRNYPIEKRVGLVNMKSLLSDTVPGVFRAYRSDGSNKIQLVDKSAFQSFVSQ